MIVSIAHELFSLENQNHIWVESIMSFFYEERHIWFIEDEEKIFQSEWFLENTPKKQQILRENIEKFISHYENGRNYYLRLPLFSVKVEDKENARSILQAPLYIIGEGASDRDFLIILISKFAKIKNPFALQLENAIQNHWAIIIGGGGNTWEKEMNNLYSKYGKNRIFIFSDSDKLYPTHESNKQKSVEKTCQKKGVVFHTLYKREIENYLPLKALKSFANDIGKTAIYEEFEKLSTDERDFYDLEKGLLAGNKETDAKDRRQFLEIQQQNGLFNNLGQDQISRLEIGFANKSKIISYFEDVTANDLTEHCKHHPVLAHQNPKGEMIDLLSKIAKAL
ncbi:MAG: hypothetical protein K1X92_10165 [Bacteroidia bacterium]|nr:hypothetical protein [Bacteroidia bacterium]